MERWYRLGSAVRRLLLPGLALLFITSTLVVARPATGEETHVYPVSLTIAVDRAERTISGTVVTEAPSEFCDSSAIRIRVVTPGNDKVAARVTPYGAEWHLKSPPSLHGKRVYAEVLPYHLPSRPVECLGARTKAVSAP